MACPCCTAVRALRRDFTGDIAENAGEVEVVAAFRGHHGHDASCGILLVHNFKTNGAATVWYGGHGCKSGV